MLLFTQRCQHSVTILHFLHLTLLDNGVEHVTTRYA